jgi:hypothetical protein
VLGKFIRSLAPVMARRSEHQLLHPNEAQEDMDGLHVPERMLHPGMGPLAHE